MRKIYLILSLLVALTSCNDDFVDVLPKGKTIPTTTDDLAEMLNHTSDINWGFRNFMAQCDDYYLPESQISQISSDYLNAYQWKDFQYTVEQEDHDWNAGYTTISRVNFVINNIDDFTKGDRYNVDNTKGRALFARAQAYFYLVNGYGKHYNVATASDDLGVPLLLESDINLKLPRSSVQVVYDQVIKDLTDAIDLLPETGETRWHASKAAVYALLGRVYLYQEKYEESAQYSKMSIDMYSEIQDYNNIVLNIPGRAEHGIKEGCIIESDYNPENLYNMVDHYDNQTLFLDFRLGSSMGPDDLRKRYFTSKFLVNGYFVGGLDVIYNGIKQTFSGIKTTEVVLNYCEALMKQKTPDFTNALAQLNRLKSMRYDETVFVDFNSTDQAVVINEIYLERRKELRQTQHRWFDMKRLGLTVYKQFLGKTYSISKGSPNYQWAIPLNVMHLNDKLVQNERGLEVSQ